MAAPAPHTHESLDRHGRRMVRDFAKRVPGGRVWYGDHATWNRVKPTCRTLHIRSQDPWHGLMRACLDRDTVRWPRTMSFAEPAEDATRGVEITFHVDESAGMLDWLVSFAHREPAALAGPYAEIGAEIDRGSVYEFTDRAWEVLREATGDERARPGFASYRKYGMKACWWPETKLKAWLATRSEQTSS